MAPDCNMPDNGIVNGGTVAEIINFPAQPQRRTVRRRSAPDAEVIDLQPRMTERERRIKIVQTAAKIRSLLAEADMVMGRSDDEAVW